MVGEIGERDRARTGLAGVLIDRVDRREVRERLLRFASDGRSHQIVTVNLDFLRAARGDSEFRDLINHSDLAVADGMPVVWLSRLRRSRIPDRITGFDLIEMACAIASADGLGVFLLGAGPGVAEAAARELTRRYRGLRIAGIYAPPIGAFTGAEEARMVAAIRGAGRCVLFVAFGAPKQDRFIRAHLRECDVPLAIGVGCAFDVLAGAVPRAPRALQRLGLEWAWRLAMEPRRLWRRYLVYDAPLLGALAVAAVRDGFVAGIEAA
jgi:N-acetylglucosaminyldiphosphoundecaprenol N-acetyl-beta-D-mannosaminyltransferase